MNIDLSSEDSTNKTKKTGYADLTAKFNIISTSRALSNSNRVKILLALYKKETISFNELANLINISSPTLTFHLSILLEAGLVSNTMTNPGLSPTRAFSFYEITEKGEKLLEMFEVSELEDAVR